MNNYKVSVLVVSYNGDKYIEKTINSCLYQTCKNIEVLLLDNASKDKTIEIVKKIRLKDNRLKVFESKQNIGPYAGLNFLLTKSKGDYIAIQDHDDIWLPEKIEKQIKFLEKNKEFIACGTNTYYYFESKKVLILNQKNFNSDFVDHTSLTFRNQGFSYDNRYLLADEHFEKKILSAKGKIACLQEAMTIHRIRGNGANLSASRFKINYRNIKDHFFINGFRWSGIEHLFYLLFIKMIPDEILWIIRKKITKKNSLWITTKDFVSNHPNLDFL